MKNVRDPKARAELSAMIERRRRELSERPDVSQTMRKLSQSSSRNPIGPQKKKRSAGLTFAISAAAVLLLLTCAAGAVVVTAGSLKLRNQLSSPSTTVEQFYSALHLKNYDQAYGYFSASAQSRLSRGAFADQYTILDQINGIVQSYPIRSAETHGNTATVVAALTRRANSDTAQLQTLHLVLENGNWRIDSIVTGDTVPIPTATS